MNKLTEQLLAEGYTKDNHPDYVEWSNYKDFEFTHKYLLETVWETPCGLLKKGINSYNHMSHMGVTYCPENNNPRFGCPYFDEKSCEYRIDTNEFWGCNCIYHLSDKSYNYEQSVEKLWDEWDRIKHEAWLEVIKDCGYCTNFNWDRKSRKYIPRYKIGACIGIKCQNEICAVTRKPRNLEKVNIFYDLLREKHYKKGLIEDTERSIEKGIKVFESPVARTDAEIWLKLNKKRFEPRKTRKDRTDEYFSENHGKTGFGEYQFFEFKATALNIRIERRESRDLLQDLRDAKEGFEVTHASDQAKAAKKNKSERRKKHQEDKIKRREKKNIAKWKSWLSDDAAAQSYAEENEVDINFLRGLAEQKLKERGIVIEKQLEQASLF